MFEYSFLIFALITGVIATYLLYIIIRGNNTKSRLLSGWIMWGPLWPTVNEYLQQRGGLTKRETIGWVIVTIFMLIGLIIAAIFPTR